MAKTPIVILHTDSLDPALDLVRSRHPDISVHGCDSYEGLPQLIDQTGANIVYSVRFSGTAAFPREAMVESETVRWVSVGGSGADHLLPWDTSRVTVTNAAGVAADMMAEYVLGTILSFSLDLPGFARAQAERRWAAGKVEPIEGKTALILGLGKTGEAVARRLKAMGLTTLGVRARPKPTENVDEVHGMDGLSALWSRADYVVCCVPLLPSTRGLVDQAAFAAMKPDSILIDVSRGGVVDEASLIAALGSGRLRGAALDVFNEEPLPADHVLWDMENVIITPHCSSVYEGWDLKSVAMFCDNLDRYRRGEPLDNVVDPDRGY